MKPLITSLLMATLLTGCGTVNDAGNIGLPDAAKSGLDYLKNSLEKVGSISPTQVSNQSQPEIFQPLEGKGEFKDIFKNTPRPTSQSLGWPRVAITYDEWGPDLKCWTIKAQIWRSAAKSNTEKFKICDVPVTDVDSIGNQTEWTALALAFVGTRMGRRTYDSHPNTGDARTIGPNPPIFPFNEVIATDGGIVPERDPGFRLKVKLSKIKQRVAVVSGWWDPAIDGRTESQIKRSDSPIHDARLWFYEFNKSGKK